MKKYILLPVLMLVTFITNAQRLLTWTPEFPLDNSNLVVTVDCNKGNQGLLNFEGGNSANVYVHVGVITNLSTSSTDWRYVPFVYGSANPAARATQLGGNKYQFSIPNVRTFFNVPAGEVILKVNFIFRNATGTIKQVNSDNSDMYIPVYLAGQYAVRLNLPPSEPRFIPWLEPINIAAGSLAIAAVATAPSSMEIKYNNTVLSANASTTALTGTATFGTNTCEQRIVANGILGASISTDTSKFFIAPSIANAPLPAGLQDGINYAANNTEVTLVLFAPNKTSAIVIGDFSNWQSQCAYQMTKTTDGNKYFLRITGLTPGQIYKFQYVVDGNLKTTDPYSELILDPNNDQFIPAANYPNMPTYPTGLTTGIVGTFQTAAPQYTWTTTSFTRPNKKSLVLYEMHLRDFLAASNWQTLADTLNYIKGLGVNAIEVMPFNEFEGNNSWGYNPDFFFAPDKAYGTKNNLKLFIDMAHSKGMAVIMDAVLNHATGLSPLAQLYWNSATSQPAANSPYFNVTATHPFSVFNDFNHESEATKYHTARYIRHWLTEYRLDGFRWDLSKGFTQTSCGSNVSCWNNFDQSRVNIWQRYYDSSQVVSAGSYNILEHLGNDDEEAELSNRGMLLWGKMTDQYNQNTMGFSASSDINRAFFGNRTGWSQPHLVSYAESHDEERIMYKNLTFGNSANAAHDVKQLPIALSRIEAMQPFLLLIPGPKMIWQFGELGYDKSIFQCENGTIPQPYGTDNCKTGPKPILWNYNTDVARKKIYNVIAGLNRIRALKPNAFLTNTISGTLGNDLKKQLIINHPDLQLVAISNFDVVAQNFTVTFPSAGTWYEYFTNATFTATGAGQTINMQPAEYRVYTNVSLCIAAAPTATTSINYCQNATATALSATGTNLLWYTSATGGTGSAIAPTPLTTIVGSIIYYVSQTINGCEGARTAITVNTTALPTAPLVISPITYCQNTIAIALTATGTNLKWYTTLTGGIGNTVAPIPPTTAIGSTSYYVSQTVGSCESPRATIIVNITASTPAPTVTSPITYCQNTTATALTAIGTSLLWYNTLTGGTGSTTAPIPSTTTIGSTIFYVSQTTSCGEGPRAAITVIVNALPAAPVVSTPIVYCQNAISTVLTATGTNLLWYTTATAGTGSTTAPTPSTTTVGSITYYVSSTVGSCEGPRASIVVTVNAVPALPIVISPVSFCQNTTATPLTAIGTNLLWYLTPTIGTGSATAPTPATTTVGSSTYYVSQTTNNCESQRAALVVNIVASTPTPTVTSPITYCQNTTATALTATGTSLLWYNTLTGGTGSETAPIPSTTTIGSTIFYVSQTTSCGEGPRAAITVNINAIPLAPSVTSPIAYCQNATATLLTATGSNLLWYTTATGGTGSASAPTPLTTVAGSSTFYVSQTVATCQSPRAAIVINVTATPALPITTPSINYCRNATALPLTATGTNLLWYTTATGGLGSATAPSPSTGTAGSTNYYVSQSIGVCEGPRALITVNITDVPSAPIVTTPIFYCQNTVATSLTTMGNNLLWYTVASGGTGSVNAPIPNTSVAGNVSFYVSQGNNCGESVRATIVITTTATPAAATNLTVTNITNTTATLNWIGAVGNFYTVQYKPTTATLWITAASGITTTTISVTGLTNGITYDWRVNANCNATQGTIFASSTFSTATRNNIITDIKNGFGLKLTPNPMRTNATLDYIVPGSGEVTISVIGNNGQTVRQLFNGTQSAGQYELNITSQLNNLLSGVYVIRLRQNGQGHSLRFVKY